MTQAPDDHLSRTAAAAVSAAAPAAAAIAFSPWSDSDSLPRMDPVSDSDAHTPPRKHGRLMSAATTPSSIVSFNVTPYRKHGRANAAGSAAGAVLGPGSVSGSTSSGSGAAYAGMSAHAAVPRLSVPPPTSAALPSASVSFIRPQSARPSLSARGARGADPVTLFHRHDAEWARDRFLASTGGGSTARSRPAAPGSPETVTGLARWELMMDKRKKPSPYELLPQYQPPTEKRRDDLRWEIRSRMMALAARNQPRPVRRRLVPNTYVAPTSLRRDQLRWDVRVQMNQTGLSL